VKGLKAERFGQTFRGVEYDHYRHARATGENYGFAIARTRAVLRLRRLRTQLAAGPWWSWLVRQGQLSAINEAIESVEAMRMGGDDAS
jgi:hypothetical protein